VFGRNVQLQTNADVIAETFEDMATGKRQIVDFSDHTQQEMPSNIYKWFILPETRLIVLYFYE